jgi:RNA polymerase sigma-70 factor (ECF subfamily)
LVIGLQEQPSDPDPVVAIYRVALPQVYGYLLPRCGSVVLAEDLTAETFMAAVVAVRQGQVREVTVAWLLGVARHKLVDHWRRVAREQRGLAAVERDQEHADDPWDEVFDTQAAHSALSRLSVPQRLALTLRYLDGLSVPEVAQELGRSLHATETLLVRARGAATGLRGVLPRAQSMTSLQRSRRCVEQGRDSARTSPPGWPSTRSCWRTPPATRSSCSSHAPATTNGPPVVRPRELDQ